MLPVKKFDLNSRFTNFVKEPISDGILPRKLFEAIFKLFKLEILYYKLKMIDDRWKVGNTNLTDIAIFTRVCHDKCSV